MHSGFLETGVTEPSSPQAQGPRHQRREAGSALQGGGGVSPLPPLPTVPMASLAPDWRLALTSFHHWEDRREPQAVCPLLSVTCLHPVLSEGRFVLEKSSCLFLGSSTFNVFESKRRRTQNRVKPLTGWGA